VTRLVLASGSPRRREILEGLGLDFEVVVPDIDETRLPDEVPPHYVERVAREKALVAVGPGRLVIAADTTVVHRGRVLGKPGHPEEARAMLRLLQGEVHEVFTGVAVAVDSLDPVIASLVEGTEVEMLPMTDEEIAAYVVSGEPMDKAGAYALQGSGGVFVSSVRGSPSNVIGLPIHLLPRLFRRVGFELDDFKV
jgi:nucleoside triphosphate pyrophosphatase